MSVGGDPALLLGSLENALAVGVPAVVELTLVLVRPFLRDVMGTVDRAACPIHEEWFVRLEGFVPVQPSDRIVGQVFAEVVALFRSFRRMHVGRIAHQVRFVLRGLAGEEAVEIFEAEAGGPVLEWASRSGLIGRRVVPLAPGGGGVAVILEHLGSQSAALRNHSGIAVPVIGQFRDLSVSYAVMIAASQKRSPCR